MNTALDKVDSFLESKITQKMQKLKEGMLFIKSQSNLEDPQESYVLYQKEYWNHTIPLAQYDQVIVTSIGTFKI